MDNYLGSEDVLPLEKLVGAAVDDAQVLGHVGLGDALLVEQEDVDLRAVAVDLLEERLDADARLVEYLLVRLDLLLVVLGDLGRVALLLLELFEYALALLLHLDALLLELTYLRLHLVDLLLQQLHLVVQLVHVVEQRVVLVLNCSCKHHTNIINIQLQ